MARKPYRTTKSIVVRRKDNPLEVYDATLVIEGKIDVDDPGTQILVPNGHWALWKIGTDCHCFIGSCDVDTMLKEYEYAEKDGDGEPASQGGA